MDEERLQYLLERFHLNKCSEAELEELDDWFHTHNPGGKDMESWLREEGGEEALAAEMFAAFQHRVSPGKGVIRMAWMYKAAAAAVLLACVVLLLFPKNRHTTSLARLEKPLNDQHAQHGGQIMPGGNKATLTLADGSVIALADSGETHIATQSNTEIKQVQTGTIAYQQAPDQGAEQAPVYNTLTTPRGGKYTITLADGTAVTLDAASSITYPVAFTGQERRVEITGQAYFEVVHNAAHPFLVVAGGHVVEDIGTAFNVNAYNDESSVKVTLAEGKVAVHNAAKKVSLVPGQQAIVKEGEPGIAVTTVNVAETVAWKTGWFVFHHESIQQVMKLAARWYDIEVAYEGAPINKTFGGTLSRYKDITELLQNLKIVSGINYRIEGRKVTLIN